MQGGKSQLWTTAKKRLALRYLLLRSNQTGFKNPVPAIMEVMMSVRRIALVVCLAVMLLGSMIVPMTSSAQGIGPVHERARSDIGIARYPDLKVVAVGHLPTRFRQPLRLGVTVKNVGFVAAPASTTHVQLYHDGALPVDVYIATPALAPGDSTTLTLWDGWGGSYRIEVDARHGINEGVFGEGNNISSGSL